MFTAALLTIAKIWKQSTSLSKEYYLAIKQIKRMNKWLPGGDGQKKKKIGEGD